MQNEREVLLRDVNCSNLFDAKDGADDNMPMSYVTVEMMGETGGNGSLDQWPDYSMDSPIDNSWDGIGA